VSKQNNHITDDLLVRYLLGEVSSEESLLVESWLGEDDKHRKQLDQLREVWKKSSLIAPATAIDEDAAWMRLKQKIGESPVQNRSFPWMRIAALFIVIAGLSWLLIGNMNNRHAETVQAMAGRNVLKQQLPDGSSVTLNKGASLSYPERFQGDQRLVKMKGEAFFSVQPDKKHPFIIEVGSITVRVVGTSFNIREAGDSTEVIVETGKVEVSNGKDLVLLQPGEKLVTRRTTMTSAVKETDELYNYYRSNQFVCDNTPLWKLMEVLSEAYDVKIIIAREALRNLQLDVTFSNESLDVILDIIRQTFQAQNIRIEKQGAQIILR